MGERCYICDQELLPEACGGSRCAGCNRLVCERHTVLYTGQAHLEGGETVPTLTQMCSTCADNYDEAIKNVVFTRGLFGISLGHHKDSSSARLAAELDALPAGRGQEEAQAELADPVAGGAVAILLPDGTATGDLGSVRCEECDAPLPGWRLDELAGGMGDFLGLVCPTCERELLAKEEE